ncbi:protease pro-enzyme activation domain-containing protein [Occallatibacter savannae]|uniref:protease pro-enzyme activation domain-containing protein n=1 Tax=Occallatibacter savannae TaxID=1002691 RepID=UPI000D6969C1|nr:protease pro-enzyme activation domain-containing protein [Occallatibacter savannae]
MLSKPFAGRGRFRVLGWLAPCVLAATSIAAQRPATRIQNEVNNSDTAPLRSGQLQPSPAEFDAGRMPSNTKLTGVSIVFNRSAQQQAALEKLLAAQQDPSSPQYHRWLTPEQFGAQFGMAQSDLDKVQTWLEQQGLAVERVARSRNEIRFSGTVGQLEQAFQTELHYYEAGSGTHFAPSTQLSMPAAIAPTVQAVTNLSSFRPRPMHVKPRTAFTSGKSGNNFFAPGDIALTYDVAPLYTAGIDGTGQSITVVGQSAIDPKDIENFQAAAGLPTKAPVMVIVPGSGSSTVVAGDEGESDLDLEWSGAIAKGATLNFVYTGSNTNFNTFDSLQYAIVEGIGNIISISYGACETAIQKSNFSLETVFQQAQAQGQTIVASSGDQGSTACSGDTNGLTQTEQDAIAVNYPASSPYVTAVGGTEISSANATSSTYWTSTSGTDLLTSVRSYIPEVSWNDNSTQYGLSSSGGGASALFTKPAWQKGVAGIPNDGKRDLPDISLYSSPNLPGYLFCTSDKSDWIGQSSSGPAQAASCSSGFRDSVSGGNYLTVAGGTSFAAPIFAGMIALINQKQGWTGGQGLTNSTLYTLASSASTYSSGFHDVTSGNNNCTAGATYCGTTTGGFAAGTGYDQVTGLGSVDLANLITAWPANTKSLLATTTTLAAATTSPNTSTNDSITITVVEASGKGTPTGTVNLSIDGGGTTYSSSGSKTSVTLGANGTATYNANFASAGVHTIIAQYAGDATHAASTGSVILTVGGTTTGKGTFKVALSPATLTIKRGSQQAETLTVTPSGGYTGTVNFTYATSNDTALTNLCVLVGTGLNSNGSASVTGTSPVSGQITIDTNAADCSGSPTTGGVVKGRGLRVLPHAKAFATAPHPPAKRSPLPAEIAFAGLLLAGFLGRSSRKLRQLACLIALASAGLVLSACGGTSGSTVSDPPKGTYTITFTGTDSANTALTSGASFTLTIN